ncbi:hypothetical protein [Elizabethkingia anophelis]|uniref:hypothetical protein n=1 Tax=Elizabethkingia anophelis TaxID=1117645 RepID=UPI0029832F44|nr:hypothetical protein [Elizabethkingia anophelis]HAY3533743.1 hypothetical protein [Elizabethkingia anophelis]HAY3545859.1 hypothetical protein [Elizabethkingia anophelis]HAY3590685.1 hypothetical protein [Elizabethkingia anophelis]
MPVNINEIRSDLASFVNRNPEAFQAALLSNSIFMSKYARRITKVDGEFPAPLALLGNVVQSFYAEKFSPFDDVVFKKKDIKTFRQKVDFKFNPASILGTIYSYKFDEGKKQEDKAISKQIFDMVIAKIIDDLDWLSVNGIRDESKTGLDKPEFGFSMDGINKVLEKNLADTTNRVYLIPGEAMTASNNINVITAFEKNLPEKAKPNIKEIFTSLADKEEYEEAYDDRFGMRPSFNANDITRSRFGKREIVGIPGLKKGTVYATLKNNFVETVDVVENPGYISDIQVADRVIKIFSEFSLGYDFFVNQYTYVHTPDATKNLGLQDSAMNKLFYPTEAKLS